MLFFMAAFIPIAVISLVSYRHINQQLQEETRRQLHQESRALGLAVYDRMLTMETLLINMASRVNTESMSLGLWDMGSLERLFDDLNLYRAGGEHSVLTGDDISLPILDARDKQHLLKGNTVITTTSEGSTSSLLFMTYARTRTGEVDDEYLLVAKPNKDFLWNFGIYTPEIACSLTVDGQKLDCSSPVTDSSIDTMIGQDGSRDRIRRWAYNDQSYIIYVWKLFLAAQFRAGDVGIMLAKPEHHLLSDINSFNTIYPKTLLITGLLVLMLSVSQIRKSLGPLEQLLNGTKRIGNGIYDKPVDIQSNDEFKVLGESFNQMAERIQGQIQTLTMMSRIDHMILSSLDANHIKQVLIDYSRDILPVDHVAVITLADENDSASTIMYNRDNKGEEIERIEIDLDSLEKLSAHASHLWLSSTDNHKYLRPLIDRGDNYFLVLLLKVRLSLTGMLCFGNREAFDVDDSRLEQLRELADRTAVALSNAAWEDKLYHQAHYDALTGLSNRYLLKDRLEQNLAWANRGNGEIALLLLDLDRFKYVNDSLGHSVGDELLVLVAERLASCVRSSDALSRFGGDEFTVILVGERYGESIYNQASHLCQRLQEQFQKPFVMQQREIFITPSIGIATCPGDADNIDDLISFADNAMYQAKSEGRGLFRFYDQVHNKDMLLKLDLETDLRHALERNELHIVYQPKISCSTGELSGAEALLRWKHPQWGDIMPADFIPLAEETGSIFEIGEWVLSTACKQMVDWQNEFQNDICIAINLSGEQFRKPGFETIVEKILMESGLSPDRLELEITENITIENMVETVAILHKFHKLGIGVSIDDFGTGYSSMSYLQQFEIDRLKIDQSFIEQIPDNKQSISIVNAIIALAHSLGLYVTAEGVETQEQYNFLIASGIDELQGAYISYPLSIPEFEIFCQQHPRIGLHTT